MTEDRKFQIKLGAFFIIVLASLFVYANVKKNEIEKIVSKNEPIRGMYGFILGDDIKNAENNKNISKIFSHSYNDYNYNYYSVEINDNSQADLTIYTTKESNKIYKIVYKNTESNACEMADSAFESLRKQYGIGSINLVDVLFGSNLINKDNKSIKVFCREYSFFGNDQRFYVIYVDEKIEKSLDVEYEEYKNNKTKENLKLN